jgi:hypothetical protein
VNTADSGPGGKSNTLGEPGGMDAVTARSGGNTNRRTTLAGGDSTGKKAVRQGDQEMVSGGDVFRSDATSCSLILLL